LLLFLVVVVVVATAKVAAARTQIDRQLADIDRDIAAARKDPARADDLVALTLTRASLMSTRETLAGDPLKSGAGKQSVFDVLSTATKTGDLKIDLGGDAELEAKATKALGDPEFVFYKMKQKGYKLSFLLVPLSLPWMILLFAWKRNVKVYDHVVFLLYSISFMSMLAMAAVAMASAGVTNGTLYGLMFTLIPVAHMFAQLKEGYALGWFSAAWRTFGLASLAALTLCLYFIGILLLGLLD
jgi:hypothetical protein